MSQIKASVVFFKISPYYIYKSIMTLGLNAIVILLDKYSWRYLQILCATERM